MVPDGAWAAKAMVRQHQAIPVEPRGADFANDFAVVAAAPDGVAVDVASRVVVCRRPSNVVLEPATDRDKLYVEHRKVRRSVRFPDPVIDPKAAPALAAVAVRERSRGDCATVMIAGISESPFCTARKDFTVAVLHKVRRIA